MTAAPSRTRRSPRLPPRRKLGEVHLLVAGKGVGDGRRGRRKIAGVGKVHARRRCRLRAPTGRERRAVAAQLMANHDAFLAPATTTGKNIAPRVAALLDVMQISEIMSVEGERYLHPPDLCRQRHRHGRSRRTPRRSSPCAARPSRRPRARAARRRSKQVDAGGDAGKSQLRLGRSVEERAARADQRQDHRLGRPRASARGDQFHALLDPARRQARRRRRREPRGGRRRLCAERLPGRPDRQDRRPGSLHRDRHFGRDPASRRA